MPPCSWMLSSATSVPMRPMLYLGGRQRALARDAVGVQRGGGIDHGRARLLDLEQQVGHAVLQRLEAADRARRTACACAGIRASPSWPLPSRPALRRTAPGCRGRRRARAWRSRGLRRPAARRRRSLHVVEASVRRRGRRRWSGSRARDRPAASAGTRNSEMPASSSTAPLVRAETTNTSACSPCGTTALAPSAPSRRRSRWRRVLHARQFVVRVGFVMRESGDACCRR